MIDYHKQTPTPPFYLLDIDGTLFNVMATYGGEQVARKIAYQFGLDLDQFNALKQYCAHNNIAMAVLIRDLIEEFIVKEAKEFKKMGIKVEEVDHAS